MSFFLNPFPEDFYGVWLLSDRQYMPDFKCPRNAGRGDELVVSFGTPPFNLSGNDADGNATNILTISHALNNPTNWSDIAVTISGATQSAVTVQEVITSLQNNAVFAAFFTAGFDSTRNMVMIKQIYPKSKQRSYVKRGAAESVLNFNKYAGVAQLPSYFSRHTIDNRFTFTDSQNALILLNPGTSTVDSNIINNAVDFKGTSLGFNAASPLKDYEILAGKSGYFTFTKNTIDANQRITRSIQYPAGAKVGDMAQVTDYSFTGTNPNPDQVTVQPYVLTSGDLVTPP